MKITFVTHTAYPEFIGGREQHVHFFAKACSELKKDDIVKKLGGMPPLKMHCSILGIEALKKAIKDYENKVKKNGK